MDAVKFLKEKNRMTNCCAVDCKKCPINDLSKQKGIYCSDVEMEYPEEVLEVVEQWSKENPVKTYKDDFLEKFPKVIRKENGMPLVGWCDIHNGGNCLYVFEEDRDCDDCWDMEMEL